MNTKLYPAGVFLRDILFKLHRANKTLILGTLQGRGIYYPYSKDKGVKCLFLFDV